MGTQLKAACTGDCQVLTIPHNPNYSQGGMFLEVDSFPQTEDTDGLSVEAAELRAELEPIMEIVQTKYESECRNGFGRYPGAEDEFCGSEKKDGELPFCADVPDPCSAEDADSETCTECLAECAEGEVFGCVGATDYARNALKRGMELEAEFGVNPHKLGFIGSTDTHNATPGNTDEDRFQGHHGMADETERERARKENG